MSEKPEAKAPAKVRTSGKEKTASKKEKSDGSKPPSARSNKSEKSDKAAASGSKPPSARSNKSERSDEAGSEKKPGAARSNKGERSDEGKDSADIAKTAEAGSAGNDQKDNSAGASTVDKKENDAPTGAAQASVAADSGGADAAKKDSAAEGTPRSTEDKGGEEKDDAGPQKEKKKGKKKKDKEAAEKKDKEAAENESKGAGDKKDEAPEKQGEEVSSKTDKEAPLKKDEGAPVKKDEEAPAKKDQDKGPPQALPSKPAPTGGLSGMSRAALPSKPAPKSGAASMGRMGHVPTHLERDKTRNWVVDEEALKADLGTVVKKFELEEGLAELLMNELGFKTIGDLAELDALREFTLEVLDAEYTPPGETDKRELNGAEVKQLKGLYEMCRKEAGMPPGPFCNRMQRFYDDSVLDFRECMDRFEIPKGMQDKLFEDGVDATARLANVPGATFRTVILGLSFTEKDGEEPRKLTKAEQINMKKCWEHCRQESGMPVQRGSEFSNEVIQGMIKRQVMVNEFGESLEKCGRTFKQIAEQFSVDPKLLEVLMTAGFDGKSKLARLQVPGEFKVQVLSLKYDHGDGTRTPLTVEDKDKLIHLLNECRKDAGFPEYHGMTPPHSPAPSKMRGLTIDEGFAYKPPSHIPITKKWLDLAKIAEENGVAPNVLRALAQIGYDTTGKMATIIVPFELNIAVLKATFDDGTGRYINFTEEEKKQVIKLHEVCRQNARIPNNDTDDDHLSAISFVKTDKVGAGEHKPTHITGAWEHGIHELMEKSGVPAHLQKLLIELGFNAPIECAPENFKVQMTRFQYKEGSGRSRYLNDDEKDQLMVLHDSCRADLGWPLHERTDPDAELNAVIARKLEEPLQPKDDPEVFVALARECELSQELIDGILRLGLNTAAKVAKIQVPGEFQVHVLSMVYEPKDEKGSRKLSDDEKQLVKHLCGKCRMLIGLPNRRDFMPKESLCVLEHMEQCNLPEALRVALQKDGITNMAAAEKFHQDGKIATYKYDPGDGGGERLLTAREAQQMEVFCVHVEHDYHPLDHSGRMVTEREERHMHDIAVHCEIPDELLEAILGIGLHNTADVARLSFPEFKMMLMNIFYVPKNEKVRRRVNKEEKHSLRMFYAECREDHGLPCRRVYLPLLEGSGACWRPLNEIVSAVGLTEEIMIALNHDGVLDTKTAAELSEDSEQFKAFLDNFKYDPNDGAHPGAGYRPINAEERKQLESAFEMCRLESIYHQDPRKGVQERAAKMEAKMGCISTLGSQCGINKELQDAIDHVGLRVVDIATMLPAEFRIHLLGIKYTPLGEAILRPLNSDEKKQLTDFYNSCRRTGGMPTRRQSHYLTPRVFVEKAPPGARGLQMRTLDELALEHGIPSGVVAELQSLNLHTTKEYGSLRQPKQLEAVVHGLKFAPEKGAEKRPLNETERMQLKWMYEDCRRELLMPSGLYNEAHLLEEVPSPMSPKRAWGDATWGDLSTTAGSGVFGSSTEDPFYQPSHHHSRRHHKSKRDRDGQENDNDNVLDDENEMGHKRSHRHHHKHDDDDGKMRHHRSHRHHDDDGMHKSKSHSKHHSGHEGKKSHHHRDYDAGDQSGGLRQSIAQRQSLAMRQAQQRLSSNPRARESAIARDATRLSMQGGPRQSTRTSTLGRAPVGSRQSKIPANVQARLSQRLSKAAALIETPGDR